MRQPAGEQARLAARPGPLTPSLAGLAEGVTDRGDHGRGRGHAHRPVEEPARGPQPATGERGHAHPVPRAGAAQHLGQQRDARLVLQVDVEAHLGPGAEQVLDQRYRLRAAHPQRLGLGVGPRADRTGRTGRPVDRAVVERHELPVRGRPGVRLQVRVAQLDGVLERRPGVLGRVRRAAAVRERVRAGGVGRPRAAAGEVFTSRACLPEGRSS